MLLSRGRRILSPYRVSFLCHLDSPKNNSPKKTEDRTMLGQNFDGQVHKTPLIIGNKCGEFSIRRFLYDFTIGKEVQLEC